MAYLLFAHKYIILLYILLLFISVVVAPGSNTLVSYERPLSASIYLYDVFPQLIPWEKL